MMGKIFLIRVDSVSVILNMILLPVNFLVSCVQLVFVENDFKVFLGKLLNYKIRIGIDTSTEPGYEPDGL